MEYYDGRKTGSKNAVPELQLPILNKADWSWYLKYNSTRSHKYSSWCTEVTRLTIHTSHKSIVQNTYTRLEQEQLSFKSGSFEHTNIAGHYILYIVCAIFQKKHVSEFGTFNVFSRLVIIASCILVQ